MLVAYLVVMVMLSAGLTGLPARAAPESWRQLPPSVQAAIEREVPSWTVVNVIRSQDGAAFIVSWTEGRRRIEIRLDAQGRLAPPPERPVAAEGPDLARRLTRP
jgi:hypothetical protein